MHPAKRHPPRAPRRLNTAESVAAERIDFLIDQAVESFKQWKAPQETIRAVQANDGLSHPVSTTRPIAGDGRLLTAAARLALLRSKAPNNRLLPALPMDIAPDEEEASAENHPVEGCSLQAFEQPLASPTQSAKGAAKPAAEKRCEPQKKVAAAPKSSNSRPVQQPPAASTPSPAASTQSSATSAEVKLMMAQMDELAHELLLRMARPS